MFYNTTHETGARLAEYRRKADSQESRVLRALRRSLLSQSASDMHQSIFCGSVPITSVRRALSNLEKDGEIEREGWTKPGPYGRPEYCYKAKGANYGDD